jgi:hypothetical protein
MAPDRSPRSLAHQIETSAVPLKVLEAVRDLRGYLDRVEVANLCDAREAGASIADIAEALGTTRQTVYNRLKAIATAREEGETPPAGTVVIPDLEAETTNPRVELDPPWGPPG